MLISCLGFLKKNNARVEMKGNLKLLLIISILPLILNAKNRLIKNYINISKIFNLRNLRNNYAGIEWIVKNKKGNKKIK